MQQLAIFVFLARSLDLQSTANIVYTRQGREEHLSCGQMCIAIMLPDRQDYNVTRQIIMLLDYNVTGPDTAVLTPLTGWLSRLQCILPDQNIANRILLFWHNLGIAETSHQQ